MALPPRRLAVALLAMAGSGAGMLAACGGDGRADVPAGGPGPRADARPPAAAAAAASGPRLSVATRSRRELRSGRVRVRVRGRLRRTTRIEVRLQAAPGLPGVALTAQRRLRPSRRASRVVRLAVTGEGRDAAASCVPLRLVATARAARTPTARASRPLPAARAACDTARSGPPGLAGRAFVPSATPPVDPEQERRAVFGTRSHWLQPWKGRLETPPAERLLGAVGMNLGRPPAGEAAATVRLLAEAGVRRMRVELGWGQFDFERPGRLLPGDEIPAALAEMRRHGVRPLVLLNAHHGAPTAVRRLRLRLAAPATRGARQVLLTPAAARRVVPRRTGFDLLTPGATRRPDVLVTSVDAAGVATLSRPLPRALAAGAHAATTIRQEPFAPPLTEDGRPNPAFEASLRGWLAYVGVATRLVHDVLGSWNFDVEVWNELSFGSDFLDASRYHDPAPAGRGRVTDEVLRRTVGWLRDPANGVGPIGIGDGFANQTPFPAGSTSVPGLTAIDKHPYPQVRRYPGEALYDADRPLDATGAPTGWRDARGRWRDPFVPAYDALFPEHHLSAIDTEHLVRDLSPEVTRVNGVAHGRSTAPPGGTPPELWVTELGVQTEQLERTRPGIDAAGVARAKRKASLRALTAYAHEGARAVHLFAARFDGWGLVEAGRRDGGPTIAALRRLTGLLERGRPVRRPRALRLVEVADAGGRVQFTGDGTPAHPALHDRDVLAFLPFGLADDVWAAPVYVMSRDVAEDLAPEPYRLRLRGIDPARARAAVHDPTTGRFEPVLVTPDADGVAVHLQADDTPRVLLLTDAR